MINWNHGNSTILNQLQGICNKFIRLTLGISRNEDVLPLMKQHNLLTINDPFHANTRSSGGLKQHTMLNYRYSSKSKLQKFQNFMELVSRCLLNSP